MKTEWYALWRFEDMDAALAAIPDLHISTGAGEEPNSEQFTGCIADALDEDECLSLTRAGGMVEVCLSFPYKNLKMRGAWISPCQLEHQRTYKLDGGDAMGGSYKWGSR